MSQSIRAHFDGRVFVPDEPVDAPINTPLRLSIENGIPHVAPKNGDTMKRDRLQRMLSSAGCIEAPVLTNEQLGRDVIYDDDLP